MSDLRFGELEIPPLRPLEEAFPQSKYPFSDRMYGQTEI